MDAEGARISGRYSVVGSTPIISTKLKRLIKMNIKDIVKNNTVYFLKYRHQVAYYSVKFEDVDYMFPVPLDDVGDATLNATEKAITYMRYIRKALDEGTFVKVI